MVWDMGQNLGKACRCWERWYSKRPELQADSNAKMENLYNDDRSVAEACFEGQGLQIGQLLSLLDFRLYR